VLDVVFSDSVEDGGFYDNNGGLDYHIPIEGGKGTMPGLKVGVVGGVLRVESACRGLGGGGRGQRAWGQAVRHLLWLTSRGGSGLLCLYLLHNLRVLASRPTPPTPTHLPLLCPPPALPPPPPRWCMWLLRWRPSPRWAAWVMW
jgi:hypothetical protein